MTKEKQLAERLREQKAKIEEMRVRGDADLRHPSTPPFNMLVECKKNIFLGEELTVHVGFVSLKEEEISSYRPIAILSPSSVDPEYKDTVASIQKYLKRGKGEIYSCTFITEGLPEGRYVLTIKHDEQAVSSHDEGIDCARRSTIEKFFWDFFGGDDLKKAAELRKIQEKEGFPPDEFTWDFLLLIRDRAVKNEILGRIPEEKREQFEGELDDVFEKGIKRWKEHVQALFGPKRAKKIFERITVPVLLARAAGMKGKD